MAQVAFVHLPGAVVMRAGEPGDCCLQEMAADEALAVARMGPLCGPCLRRMASPSLLNAVERAIAAQARLPVDLLRGELA